MSETENNRRPAGLRFLRLSSLSRPLILFVTAMLVAGCNLKDRIVWSPDGQHMAVIAADGLRISNPEGVLSRPLVANADLVSWCPDSKRALVVRQKQSRDWKEIESFLLPGDLEQVRSTAEVMRRELLANGPDFDKCEKSVTADKDYHRRFLAEALYCLRANYNRQLSDKLGSDWTELAFDPINLNDLQLYELKDNAAAPGKVIYRTTRDIGVVRVSPNGKVAAVVDFASSESSSLRLYVLPLSGGEPRLVTDSALQYPDWSPDGRSLFFMEDKNSSFQSVYFATLRSLAVCNADGDLKNDFGESVELIKLAHRTNEERVRCLKDGAVLFSALPVQLPGKNLSGENNLFELVPDQEVPSPLIPERLSTDIKAQYFEVSPDGKKVAIPGGHGEVVVVDLSSKAVTSIQDRQEEIDSVKFVPQWRNADELCFALGAVRKSITDHDCEVALKSLSAGTLKILSKSWPLQATKGLLTSDKEPATKLEKLIRDLK